MNNSGWRWAWLSGRLVGGAGTNQPLSQAQQPINARFVSGWRPVGRDARGVV